MPSRNCSSRDDGIQELEILTNMVQGWKDGYFREVPSEGGEDYLFLCKDFMLEIEEYVYPYLRRMRETDHLDHQQVSEFLDFCYRQVGELEEFLTHGRKP